MTWDWRVGPAAAALRRGAVIAHATEAVIGLAALARNAAGARRIRELKRRPRDKSFIVVAASTLQLAGLVSLEVPLRAEIDASWPGPHTWILPAARFAPRWLVSKNDDIAVRVTAHPQMSALCRLAGPIVSTSANPSGRRPARSQFQVRRYFGGGVDHYLAGTLGGAARPTSIRDGRSGRVLRA